MEKIVREEIHDIADKIYELQQKSEKLTNGQRYAAINEIEKIITPLRNDLRKLEHDLYTQNNDRKEIISQIDKISHQIADLENIKSDLTARINTETEEAIQNLNDKITTYMKEAVEPLKTAVQNNQNEVLAVKESIYELKLEIKENEKNRDLNDAKKFDRFKWIITGVVASLAAISSLSLWLEPSIRILVHILTG
jgi:chromosome segregation ATPase